MKFKSEMTIGPGAAMNCEKRGNEPGDVGTSISISGDVHVDDLAEMFTTPEIHEQVLKRLYGKDDQLAVPDIGSISLKQEFEKVNCSFSGPVLQDERLAFSGGKMKEITLVPKANRAIGFSAKLYVYATEKQYAEIPKLLRHEIVVSVTSGKIIPEKQKAQKALELPEQGDKKVAPVMDAPGRAQ